MTLLTSTANAVLTHQYTFNDGTANDSVGTANGTLMGGATVANGQVHFSGASDTYVSLPGPAIAINTYVDATFEGWFTYNNSASHWQRLFDFGNSSLGNGLNYVFYSPDSDQADNRAAIGAGSPETVANGGATLSTGIAHYVAVVVDGTQNDGGLNAINGKMYLYVDGVLAAPAPSF